MDEQESEQCRAKVNVFVLHGGGKNDLEGHYKDTTDRALHKTRV